MGRTPVRYREPGVDPSQDQIPLRQASLKPLLTCGVIAIVIAFVACGVVTFVSAQYGSKPTPTAELPTATSSPDNWAATGTAIAEWTATATPTTTATPTATLDAWDMTGTAIFWQTYTPTPTETPTVRPTSDRPALQPVLDWWANVQATAQVMRTQYWMDATVTAQAITPTTEPTARVEYIEVTRVVNGGGGGNNAGPEIRYVEVTPHGWQPPSNPPPAKPTDWIVPLPTVNPTYFTWLTWTATPTSVGPTPTASATEPWTLTPTPTASPTLTETYTSVPPTSTDTPTWTPTPSPTSTETPTETPYVEPTVETLIGS